MGNLVQKLSDISKELLHELERVEIVSARIITATKRQDHITHISKGLHWIVVEHCFKLKFLLFILKTLNRAAPLYIRYLPVSTLLS